mmetsp:Transcript_17141/g.51804  ORF Transcript_17141/g.51804 Transcript_17141/m.51804 type:complete len:222 (-) Transcript_17141:442-1107(-)
MPARPYSSQLRLGRWPGRPQHSPGTQPRAPQTRLLLPWLTNPSLLSRRFSGKARRDSGQLLLRLRPDQPQRWLRWPRLLQLRRLASGMPSCRNHSKQLLHHLLHLILSSKSHLLSARQRSRSRPPRPRQQSWQLPRSRRLTRRQWSQNLPSPWTSSQCSNLRLKSGYGKSPNSNLRRPHRRWGLPAPMPQALKRLVFRPNQRLANGQLARPRQRGSRCLPE